MTRARRRLYLSFAQSRMLHGQTRYNVQSRFLDEIPDNLMKWLQPVQKLDASYFGSSAENQFAEPVRNASDFGKRRSELINQNSQTDQWRVGQNVSHAKFGAGVIINCEGQGSDARVQVRFDRVGMKWLLLEFAKLTPA